MRSRWVCSTLPILFLTSVVSTALAAPPENEVLGLREAKLEIKDLKLLLTERIATLERAHSVIFGLLGVSPLALVGFYLYGLRRARRLIDARLERLIESRPKALLKLIDEYDLNQRLRRETRVAIVSNHLVLEGILRQHGFRKLTTIGSKDLTGMQVPKEQAEALTGARAVVLDMVHGIHEVQATEIIKRHGLEHVLAFSYGRVDLSKGEATFANSPMTLFSRLEELLKYQDALERS